MSINRIVTRTPSTGRPISATISDVPNVFTKLISSPDFSVPDPSGRFENRDPEDPASRAIRGGEVFVLTPLAVRNKDTQTRTIEIRLKREDGEIFEFGEAEVPAKDTALIPIQGRSLTKLDPISNDGDAIEIRAETNNVFDVWLSAEERLANEHTGVISTP